MFFYIDEEKYPRITVPQKNSQLLYKLEKLFGGSVSQRKSKDKCFEWKIFSKQAVGLMMTLYPLMSDKRKSEITVALVSWKNNKKTHCINGHPWVEENIYSCKSQQSACWTCKKEKAKKYKQIKQAEIYQGLK